jgi:hypothetical protein
MAKNYITISDLQSSPSPIQEAIVNNHEDLGGEIQAILYDKDGFTVYFKVADGDEYVACTPTLKFKE